MAALTRPTEATYTIHEKMTVNTSDREDHTFCGVMFPVVCKELLPVERVVITSLAVRGRLGPLTVWVSKDPDAANSTVAHRKSKKNRITADGTQWTQIYSKFHPPSFSEYSKLDISHSPIVVQPGQVRGIYIHSTLPGDEAIVYDNYLRHSKYGLDNDSSNNTGEKPVSDSFIILKPAMAHVSETPFGRTPIWGWGDPWRRDRKFVGRLEYGVVYKLWNPTEHLLFGDKFQKLTITLFACQRNWESPMSRLPDECIYYILNMCKWDWAGDDSQGMKKIVERKKSRNSNINKSTAGAMDVDANLTEDLNNDTKPSRIPTTHSDDDEDIDIGAFDDDDNDDEDWEEDDDDDYSDHDGLGNVLYSDDASTEEEQDTVHQSRTEGLRRYLNRHTDRHLVLGEFISAVGTVMMQLGSDDDSETN